MDMPWGECKVLLHAIGLGHDIAVADAQQEGKLFYYFNQIEEC